MPKGVPAAGFRKSRKWKDDFYVRSYQLALEGLTDKAIAKTLGMSIVTFRKFLKYKPALAEGLKMARGKVDPRNTKGETFSEYIYKKLDPVLKDRWDKLKAWENEPNGTRKIERMFAEGGRRMRQHLFIHAVVNSAFNLSEACRKVMIPKSVFEDWCLNDPTFAKLVEEIQWHKKNFFETALVKLARQGDTNAILFANKSLNKDRGYNDKVEVEHKHTHSGTIGHAVVKVKELPLEVRKAMMRQLQDKKKEAEKRIEVRAIEDTK